MKRAIILTWFDGDNGSIVTYKQKQNRKNSAKLVDIALLQISLISLKPIHPAMLPFLLSLYSSLFAFISFAKVSSTEPQILIHWNAFVNMFGFFFCF